MVSEEARARTRHSIAMVGLGATGIAIARSLHQRDDCRLVAAVDIDPDRCGRDLGELLGVGALGVEVTSALAELTAARPDIAVVATTSLLAMLELTVLPLLDASVNVVSICEELAYARVSHPAIADRLDRAAVAAGVSVLGTGVNPGFIMDTLPLVLSGLVQHVQRVAIRRTADMSSYGAIVRKFGLGMTTGEFDAAQSAGTVMGHIGFEQSIGLLAAGLGWGLDEIEVDPVRPAFIAPTERRGAHSTVAPGTVAAVVHSARGCCDGEVTIDLTIHFGFFAPDDPVEPGDACRIEGDDQVIEVASIRGFDSFRSTVAIASNVATAVVDLRPGLRTMSDLPIGTLACRGTRRSVVRG